MLGENNLFDLLFLRVADLQQLSMVENINLVSPSFSFTHVQLIILITLINKSISALYNHNTSVTLSINSATAYYKIIVFLFYNALLLPNAGGLLIFRFVDFCCRLFIPAWTSTLTISMVPNTCLDLGFSLSTPTTEVTVLLL